jgi:hypothetical protein
LVTEESWINGGPAYYGEKGSVRLDVRDKVSNDVFDYKFTVNPPGLSSKQKTRIINNGPGIGQVIEINP